MITIRSMLLQWAVAGKTSRCSTPDRSESRYHRLLQQAVRVLLTTLFLLSGFRSVMAQQQAGDGDTKSAKFAIALHGGAGRTAADGPRRANIEAALSESLNIGTQILQNDGSAIDAVEAVVRSLEDSEHFNAGKGAVFNAVGGHELDASIMDGSTRAAGAVGGVRTVRNPVSLARLVMTETRHVLLVTDGAEQFADLFPNHEKITRVPNEWFSTPRRREQFEEARRREAAREQPRLSERISTVGCVALDRHGHLAAATSTGGLTNKKFGRVGDSPIIGAGTYADDRTCAVSCTGIGEDFIRNSVAFDVSARMAYRGQTVEEAVREILTDQTDLVRGGLIAVDRMGRITMQYNTEGMARAAANSDGYHEVSAGTPPPVSQD